MVTEHIDPVFCSPLTAFLSSSGKSSQEEIIVAPTTPAVTTLAAQLTEDNEDFANRGRYHQSEVVQGENFDDYEDDSEN